MRKFKVTLEQQERDSLVAITQKGNHQSRKVLNALILLNCDQGQFQDRCLRNEDVAAVLKISLRKIDRVKKRFVEEGLDVALHGRKGQRVYEKKADGDFEAHFVAAQLQPAAGRVFTMVATAARRPHRTRILFRAASGGMWRPFGFKLTFRQSIGRRFTRLGPSPR